jgi:hypothetical protein
MNRFVKFAYTVNIWQACGQIPGTTKAKPTVNDTAGFYYTGKPEFTALMKRIENRFN